MMTGHLYSSKVTPEHLARKAVVYVRQSSDRQVRENKESQRLQYSLADTARNWGWRDVEVIDSDLGSSAALAAKERKGFERLIASVALKEIGIILSREVSRLLRTDKDWCRLCEVCQVFGTLISNGESVYDLRLTDDQAVLGIKGTLSVVEMGILRRRLLEASELKAREGKLVRLLAPGYVRDGEGAVVKDPDSRVREAMAIVFRKFRERGYPVASTSFWGYPGAVEDYPRTLLELETRFATEDACREYLAALRWPGGFVCPGCGSRKAWTMARGLWLCAGCRRQVSVTAGTVFDRSRSPLVLWFRAMWYVTSQKNGASALGVQRVLGLRSYETAWTWLHKLRGAMVRPGRHRLKGTVEVDETYVGGEEKGAAGRYTETKAIVAIALEMHFPKGFGRVRLHRVSGVSAADLTPFVCAAVEPGSVVRTDGWKGYNEIAKHGYQREMTVISSTGDPAHVAMPGVHRVAALLKRWLLGTHQGAVSRKHLDYYLDEFTFRFNRRTSGSRGKLFYRLVQHAVQVQPLPYRAIVGRPEVE